MKNTHKDICVWSKYLPPAGFLLVSEVGISVHLFLDVLTFTFLFCQGEMSFEQDCLVEGGRLNKMHNGTGYKEVRQFQSAHHLVRFYFVTQIYSDYMKSILEDFRSGLKPDVIIANSCVWDISR